MTLSHTDSLGLSMCAKLRSKGEAMLLRNGSQLFLQNRSTRRTWMHSANPLYPPLLCRPMECELSAPFHSGPVLPVTSDPMFAIPRSLGLGGRSVCTSCLRQLLEVGALMQPPPPPPPPRPPLPPPPPPRAALADAPAMSSVSYTAYAPSIPGPSIPPVWSHSRGGVPCASLSQGRSSCTASPVHAVDAGAEASHSLTVRTKLTVCTLWPGRQGGGGLGHRLSCATAAPSLWRAGAGVPCVCGPCVLERVRGLACSLGRGRVGHQGAEVAPASRGTTVPL